MAEREHCIYCTREVAVKEDWDRIDQERPELDVLCWGQRETDCKDEAERIGRPAEMEDALEALDQARLVAGRNSDRAVGAMVEWQDRARDAEAALQSIANGETPGVSFAEPDLISEFAQRVLARLGGGNG